MKTRLKTAGVMILALLVLVWLDIYILNFAIFAVALGIAVMESLKLYGIKENDLAILSVILFAVFALLGGGSFAYTYQFIIAIILISSSVLVFKNHESLKPLLPLIYPTAPIFVMFSVYDVLGMSYLVYMLILVAVADSGAYFVGKLLGSHSFTPTSPNKTIEGTIGGIILATFIGGLYYGIFMDGSLKNPLFATIFIIIASIFGDLFESYLKRKAGVKDSGNLFPGHGGMLDRIDSYLFASIALSLVSSW